MDKKDFINKVFITNSFEETRRLGRDFAKSLRVRDIICLYGDLGSGKTTFVQGLAEGLGIKRRIISPTFIIVRCYELQNKKSKIKNKNYNFKLKNLERFYHIDLYRVKSDDLRGLGVEEILNDSSNIVVIEWAKNLGKFLPEKRIDIKFAYEGENKRKISFALGF